MAAPSGFGAIQGPGLWRASVQSDETSDKSKQRGAVRSSGEFSINDRWLWVWDGTATSDKEFLDEYDFDDREIAQSDVHVRGLWDRTYVNAQALNFQSLSDGISQDHLPSLPYVTGEPIGQQVFGGELSFKWSSYAIWRDDANAPFATVNHGTQQSRAVGELRWEVADDQRCRPGHDAICQPAQRRDLHGKRAGGCGQFRDGERLLPSAGFDMRYPFMANYAFGQSIFSPAFQVIAASDETETVSIGNEDAITLNFDHTSLFLEDRFTGLDRYEGAARAPMWA